MPIRLRLSSQIAAILCLLFLVATGLITYFNVSILMEVLEANARLEYRTRSMDAVSQIDAMIPPEVRSPTAFPNWTAARTSLLPVFNRLGNVRLFQMFDSSGHVLWEYSPSRDYVSDPNQATVNAATSTGGWGEFCQMDANNQLHVVAPGEYNPTRLATWELYHTVQSSHGPIGGYHLAFVITEIFERVRLVLVGDIALAIIFGLTAIVAVTWWTEYAIHRPLNFILQAQERLGKGDFNAVIPFGEAASDNEIATISGSFNRMTTDLSRFQAQLVEKSELLMERNRQYRTLNEQLEAQVEEKTRELREFYSLVTHELKVPLAAIQGYTHLMLGRSSDLTEKQRKYMQSIGTATWHLLSLVRNMMDSVRYDAGRIHFYLDAFELPDLTHEVESHLTPAMDEHHVSLSISIGPGCETIYGDRTKVGQVLINLVSNAARFSPAHGTVELQAVGDGDLVKIMVRDKGPGIAQENLPHLFEKFSQFSTADASAQGLGLGLYIVWRILQGHGQKIEVDSRPDEGTAFTFWLAKRAPEAAALMTTQGGGEPSYES